MTASHTSIADSALDRIAAAPIEMSPFPHIIVPDLLPWELYWAALHAIERRTAFEKVSYPGTGFGRRASNYHDFGYAYRGLTGLTVLSVSSMKCSRAVVLARVLLDKFSQVAPSAGVAIPAEKHRHFAHGASDHSTVFDLQIDLPGYAIAPHRDVPSKIVTFQLYLTKDDSLASHGTQLCKPIDGLYRHRRPPVERMVGRALSLLPRRNRLSRRIERSRLGLRLGVGDTANWYPWEWFTVAKIAHPRPNHFLAFAPNERSFHAVDLSVSPRSPVQERAVLRGFVRQGRSTRNWIEPRHRP